MQFTQFWVAAPALLVAFLLQTTWLAHVEFFGVHVDLPLLVAVPVALLGGVQRGAWAGFFAGLLSGYGAAWHLGSFVVSRTLTISALGFFPRRFSPDNVLAPPLCAVVATLGSDLLFAVISPTDFSVAWWVHHALASSIAHAILIWPIHLLMRRLMLPPAKLMFGR